MSSQPEARKQHQEEDNKSPLAGLTGRSNYERKHTEAWLASSVSLMLNSPSTRSSRIQTDSVWGSCSNQGVENFHDNVPGKNLYVGHRQMAEEHNKLAFSTSQNPEKEYEYTLPRH